MLEKGRKTAKISVRDIREKGIKNLETRGRGGD